MKKPKKYVMTRIGVLSTAKISAAIMLIIGFIIGVFAALFGMAFYYTGVESSGLASFLAVIYLPIFYAIMGFVFGAISAWLYNLAAKRIGGIEFDLRDK